MSTTNSHNTSADNTSADNTPSTGAGDAPTESFPPVGGGDRHAAGVDALSSDAPADTPNTTEQPADTEPADTEPAHTELEETELEDADAVSGPVRPWLDSYRTQPRGRRDGPLSWMRLQEPGTRAVVVAATIAAVVIIAGGIVVGAHLRHRSADSSGVVADPSHALTIGVDGGSSGSRGVGQVDVPAALPDTASTGGSYELTITSGGKTVGSAGVDPVLLAGDALVPPSDISRLGWYSSSARPGSRAGDGSTVITGHINEAGVGDGFAHHFTETHVGDQIVLTANGHQASYRVAQLPFHVAKNAALPAVVNQTAGGNVLVLVTCGGQYVGGATGYADNIITVATPV